MPAPTDSAKNIGWLIFDVESVADGQLVSDIRYPGEGLAAGEAIDRYRAELIEQYGTDFVPYTYQVPVSVVVAKLDPGFRLLDVVALDEPEFRPHEIAERFWRGWLGYHKPTLVSFNGRGFDVPLLELAAFRFGISAPAWFNLDDRTWDQRRNRYNLKSHFDLQDFFTNFGASRVSGGLNLIARLIGKPGKMNVTGDQVQDLYNQGRLQEISDYCRCDVLDTYFVFLRASVVRGQLSLDEEEKLVAQTRQWIEDQADDQAGYAAYLEQWGDWNNPWAEA